MDPFNIRLNYQRKDGCEGKNITGWKHETTLTVCYAYIALKEHNPVTNRE